MHVYFNICCRLCNTSSNTIIIDVLFIFAEFVRPPAPPPPPPPPPTCPPCPTCPTTTPTPPELQCPVCTCTPVYHGSYGSLKANEQSSYSCSRAHTPEINGISPSWKYYYGVLSCPTLCFAQCGSTFHCCTGTPTTTTPVPPSSPPAKGNHHQLVSHLMLELTWRMVSL